VGEPEERGEEFCSEEFCPEEFCPEEFWNIPEGSGRSRPRDNRLCPQRTDLPVTVSTPQGM